MDNGATNTTSFHSPKEHYVADATAVWCFDCRFRKALGALCNHLGINPAKVDEIKVGGGARTLASAGGETKIILDQILASVKLHNSKRVIVMTHSDCGACGGLAAFRNNPRFEKQEYEKMHRNIRQLLSANLPAETQVISVFVDFDKIYIL